MSRRDRTLVVPLLLAAVLGGAAAGWTWTRPADPSLAPTGGQGIAVHILDNGFHTDLAVPRAVLEARAGPLGEAVRSLAPGDWILIGWGDAKFYVDQRSIGDRLPDGPRAFFRPGNASVIMLDPERTDPRLRFAPEGRAALTLSPTGFDRMADRIEHSLKLADGHARIAAARPGDDARFFASRETFWIGYLCNHWSARVLNAAGLQVRPLRSATSAEVMATVRAAELDRPPSQD